jgi:hypothetical protein
MTPEEQDVIDALIVLALTERTDSGGGDTLGPDLVDRILSGEWKPKTRKRKKRNRSGLELAGSMNRGDGELSDEARAEIERKIREIEEELNPP